MSKILLQRYKENLLELKETVVQAVELGQEGVLEEDEVMPLLEECEKEIREIEDCINTLYFLLRRRRCDE